MPTFRILVFGMYCWLTEILKPANQQNNAAETSKFAVATFLI